MVKDVLLGVHVPLDLVDLVGPMRAVVGHDNGSLELTVHEVGVMAQPSLLDEGEAVFDR